MILIYVNFVHLDNIKLLLGYLVHEAYEMNPEIILPRFCKAFSNKNDWRVIEKKSDSKLDLF